jgi:centromeric protein E
VSVSGLTQQQIENFEQAMILMNYGEENRVYKETHVHEHSSRSHTIFRLYIQKTVYRATKAKVEGEAPEVEQQHQRKQIYYSTLNLVDLAGSERLSEIEMKSDVQDETAHINKSLFTLSLVVNKLAEGNATHIPYRDSKLTRILQNSLGGNSLTAIICTISPASINFFQTLSTLKFAQRASSVKYLAEQNQLNEKTDGIKGMEQKISRLTSRLKEKEAQLKSVND